MVCQGHANTKIRERTQWHSWRAEQCQIDNVDQRVMELQKEVLGRLSDIQRGLEVWISSLCEPAHLFIVLL